MEYKLNPDFNTIEWSQLTGLFQKVGWGERPSSEIKLAFEKSSFTFFIYDNNNIVGFGRTMDDGKYYAMLVDIIVHPDYQGKRLGTLIANTLKDKLTGFLFVTLTSAPDKEDFYKKLGWKKQSLSFLWPMNENQKRLYCDSEE